MWSVYMEQDITPDKVVWMMTLLKSARDMNTPKYDNSLDTIGYQACLDDMVAQVQELGHASDYQAGLDYLRSLTVGAMQELAVRISDGQEATPTVKPVEFEEDDMVFYKDHERLYRVDEIIGDRLVLANAIEEMDTIADVKDVVKYTYLKVGDDVRGLDDVGEYWDTIVVVDRNDYLLPYRLADSGWVTARDVDKA